MDVDAFTQNLKVEILKRARGPLKEKLQSELKNLNCKKCNSPSYAITDYPDDNAILAHIKCQNCGSEETVYINSTGVDEGLNGVNDGIRDLQQAIEDANRKINQY